MKKLFLIALAACAAFAAAPHRAEAGTCGISGKGTLWIDFADGSVPFWQEFARPGVIAAAANFIYPPQLRALGAKTIYWDMYLPRRVGTPLEPFDPAVVIDRANRIYDTATMSSGCTQPMIAENELNGANTLTPWTATNAQYRRNVLIYVQTLAARGRSRCCSSRASPTWAARPATGGGRCRTTPTSCASPTSRRRRSRSRGR